MTEYRLAYVKTDVDMSPVKEHDYTTSKVFKIPGWGIDRVVDFQVDGVGLVTMWVLLKKKEDEK